MIIFWYNATMRMEDRQKGYYEEVASLLGITPQQRQPIQAIPNGHNPITTEQPNKNRQERAIAMINSLPYLRDVIENPNPESEDIGYDPTRNFIHLQAATDIKQIPQLLFTITDTEMGRHVFNNLLRRYLTRKYRTSEVDLERWRRWKGLVVLNMSAHADKFSASYTSQLREILSFKKGFGKNGESNIYTHSPKLRDIPKH